MIILTFFSEKGGTGKTTFNLLLASYLSYIVGQRVLYIDCDEPSFHSAGIRSREEKYYKEGNTTISRFFTGQTKVYPIITISKINDNIEDVISQITELKRSATYDYIILDLPGSLNIQGVNNIITSRLIDCLIIPLEDDNQTIVTDLNLAKAIIANGQKCFLFWNKAYSQELKHYELKKRYLREKKSLPVLETVIKNSVKIRREWDGENLTFIRSTICYPQKNIEQLNLTCITNLITEVLCLLVKN